MYSLVPLCIFCYFIFSIFNGFPHFLVAYLLPFFPNWMILLEQGFRSFVWTAVSYQLKDHLKLSPSASQFVSSVVFFPWSIKPFYGYVSEFFCHVNYLDLYNVDFYQLRTTIDLRRENWVITHSSINVHIHLWHYVIEQLNIWSWDMKMKILEIMIYK